MNRLINVGGKMFTESKLIQLINSSPIAISEGITINTSPKPSTIIERKSPRRLSLKRYYGSFSSSSDSFNNDKSPRRLSPKRIPDRRSPRRMERSIENSSSSSSVDYDDHDLAAILSTVFYDHFGFSPRRLPNYDDLFESVYNRLIEYLQDGGGTMEEHSVLNGISLFLFGRLWPTYADSADVKRLFNDALDALKLTYGKM